MDIKEILALLNKDTNTENNKLMNLLPLLMNIQKDKPKTQKSFDENINFTVKKLFD